MATSKALASTFLRFTAPLRRKLYSCQDHRNHRNLHQVIFGGMAVLWELLAFPRGCVERLSLSVLPHF